MCVSERLHQTYVTSKATYSLMFTQRSFSLEDLSVIINICVCDVQFETSRGLTVEDLTTEDLATSTNGSVFINSFYKVYIGKLTSAK